MKRVVLQSMTDFIREVKENEPECKNFGDVTVLADYIKNGYHKMIRYQEFISQKLELWMFVPCELVDGEWIPLIDPGLIPSKELNEYRQAKERVLFEGFEYKCHREVFNSELGLTICFNTNSFQVDGSLGVGGGYFINNTVEFFTNMGMVLTPTAVKQLGLWQS